VAFVEKSKPESELLAAAQTFDEHLADFARLAAAASRAPLDSQKNLQRVAHVFEEIGIAEKKLGKAAEILVAELGNARKKQEEQADAIRRRAQEIEQRTGVATGLLERYSTIGEMAGELNNFIQALSQKQRDDSPEGRGELLTALREARGRMIDVTEKAATLTVDARTADFQDIARQVDSLRQQVASAAEKVAGLERLIAGN
jgi:hypothetical protein